MSPIFTSSELAPTVADNPPGPPPHPRLRSNERCPDPARWATVIPPTFAEQVAGSEALEAHRELVERVAVAATKVAELEAAHSLSIQKDRQTEQAFATKGRKLPPLAGPDAEAAAGQARRELELLERELDADDERVEQAIGEALRVLDERATVAREAQWIGQALWESSIVPCGHTRAVANTLVAAELRQVIGRLRDERQEAARRRFERQVELEMLFNPDRSPKRADGRPVSVRRAEAEQVVREREAAA